MTFAVHARSVFKAFAPVLCAFLLASLVGAPPARAASEPNGTYTGTSLTGNNTYAQVQLSGRGSIFTYSNGTLTLTGNNGGTLFVARSRAARLSLSSDSGDATLVLQKGTFGGNIGLSGTANASTLLVGTGATSNRPTVTITGGLMGSSNGFSHVRTQGATSSSTAWWATAISLASCRPSTAISA